MDDDILKREAVILTTDWGAITIDQYDGELVIFTEEFDVPITIVDPAGEDIVRLPESR